MVAKDGLNRLANRLERCVWRNAILYLDRLQVFQKLGVAQVQPIPHGSK
jgi:hypothetical protein